MRNALFVLTLAGVAGCSEPIRLDWKYDIGAPSVSTPRVTDSFVTFGSENGVTVLELDGSLRCHFDAHGVVISAPASDGQRIFFGSTNYIFYAIDSACKELWKFPTRDRIKSDPLLVGDRVIVSSYDGHLYALEAATGRAVWTFPKLPLANLEASSQGAGIGVEGEAMRLKRGGKVSGFGEAADAEPKTKAKAKAKAKRAPAKNLEVGDFSYSSPVLADGVIYVGNLDHYLYAIDANDGTLRWRFRTLAAITSTPLVKDNVVYFGSNDGNVYALDFEDFEVRWKMATQEWVNSSARIEADTLYIGANDRHIYALDWVSGEEHWKFQTKGPAISVPVVYENLVIGCGGSGDGAIYALQKIDGTLFWRFETGGKIDSDPVVVGNKLYVTSADGFLYAFSIERTKAE